MDSSDLVALNSQYVSHAPGTEIGFFEIDLVYYAHEFPVGIAELGRSIVVAIGIVW